jgi:vibriolysin
MLKRFFGFILICVFYTAWGTAEALNLYKAPLSSLKHFSLMKRTKKDIPSTLDSRVLQEINLTKAGSRTITRYQQLYQGLPVIGAQVMVTQEANKKQVTQDNTQINGRVFDAIHLGTKPALTKTQALTVAHTSWLHFNPNTLMKDEHVELQIRSEHNELKLVYQVSFRSMTNKGKPAWLFFIVDANTGTLIKQWNNIKNFADYGPGGNEKVKEYWYGKEGLPSLEVTQNGGSCVMESSKVKLVNLMFSWDWFDLIALPYQYPCNNNTEDFINGAFSPINDAYYFGHTVVDMYQEWYSVNVLQQPDGTLKQLVMRVHFGENYDNAFWDGQYMSFGDGSDFYPLVSLDVTAHEVTHGFTEQHSNLEYHDQSGALNESLSDMAAPAARAYLLEQFPTLYNKAYLEPNVVTWGIGETVVRDSFGKALRFMDFPSSDGSSADCLDKSLAQNNGAYCAISYDEVVAYADANILDPPEKQDFIVHTASGVFNKAFYLLAKDLGIKKAYQLMIIANSKYWTPTTNFVEGACGVLYSARDLAVDASIIKSAFNQVGVTTSSCT